VEELGTTRVLCVDDDIATLELRKVLLADAGYAVLTASSGAEALGMIAEGLTVDLVLLDYLMPGMNGDELAAKLRKQHPSLPLIAVSAVGQLPHTLLDAVDSYVQKGPDPQVLLFVMSQVLASPQGHRDGERLARQRTILCVEDDDLELKLRKMLFESFNFLVLPATSASLALEIFKSRRVDAVVMDYWLSGKSGTAVADEMKRFRPRIPIVMLSGSPALPGENMVVDAWLRKGSVNPDDIVNEVNRLISLRADVFRADNLPSSTS
jgi:CheY-like chemotaxis protein